MDIRGWRTLAAATASWVMLAAASVAVSASAPSGAEVGFRLSAAQSQAAGVKVDAVRVASTPKQPETARGLRLAGQVITPGDTSGVILSTVSGQLESVLVHIGAHVQAGQPLARIYSTELPGMQQSYLQARTAAELAAAHVTRDEALFREGIISENRLRETRAARQLAVATERSQRRLLALAGYSNTAIDAISPATISSTLTLHAPGDAIVLAQSAMAGQHLEPGSELFRLSSSSSLWLELAASVRQAGAIHVGDLVSIAGCSGTGHVIAVGTQLNPSSQTLPVRAEFPNTSGCVHTNQYVEADVKPASAPVGLVSVPAGALVRHAENQYVFVKRADAFHPVRVQVERQQGSDVWLRPGSVSVGTQVAVSGITALKGAWLGLGPQLDPPEAR
jgi:multidrug efflux pump subunit AcrA (membrane-fusion protein)